MFISTFQYKPEHMDCTLCAQFSKKKGCKASTCPWMAERIEAGVVSYKEAVMETFPRDAHLDARLDSVVSCFTGSMFLTPAHQHRMERMQAQQVSNYNRDTPAYFAAMYLLTSNEDLCGRTVNCYRAHGMEFNYAVLRGISPHNYTLFSVARDIGTDSTHATVSDLADVEVVDALAFSLIVNALLIARYGCAVLKISDREGKT